jgi:transcriptional regulator with XRE-family HTH domain
MTPARRRIGLKIKRLREALDMTQEQLSKRARVSQSYLSQLESGSRGKMPGLKVAQKIAKALNVSLEDLLT